MIREDRQKLKYLVDALVKSLDLIGTSFNKTEPGIRKHTILDLLFRIRCNLTGISELLKFWPESNAFQPPISNLYRTVVTDLITLLYFLTFYDDKESFINELFVLNRKYIKSIERYINNLHTEMLTSTPEEIEAEKQKQRGQLYGNSDEQLFYEGTFKLKTPKDLRKSSNPELFRKIENMSTDLGDTQMFEQISLHPLTHWYSQIFNLYKYLSQHQHYSTSGRYIATFPPEIELKQWLLSTTHSWEILIRLARFFEVESAIQQLENVEDVITDFRSI
ncbi:hypothetical protein [Pontibacter russatus]|uniref:hypothetical protein n=1 Tax=Pontibacter russatus TaxID=2694929 RepID=UPI00137B3A01|nr:hypothetical protein [Pontibacter russatus]